MGHSGKDTISPKEIMVHYKCSPSQQFTRQGQLSPGAPQVPPPRSGHIPVIRPTSFTFTPCRHLPDAPREPPLASQRNNFIWQQNRAGEMLQGLRTCPNCQIFLMTNLTKIIRVMIRRTWAERKARPHQLEANAILLEAICQNDGAANLSAFNK
jgi:hypothetical protein